MAGPSKLVVTTVKRNQRRTGPTSSDQQNDFQAEVIRDLTAIQIQWNNTIVPLLKQLADGTQDSSVNVFNTGLDGTTLYSNAKVDPSLMNGTFYNETKDRPLTVYEQFLDVYQYIDSQITSVSSSTAALELSQLENEVDGLAASLALLDTIVTVPYAATRSLDMLNGASQDITLTGAVTFTITNIIKGSRLEVRITADGTNRNMSFPVDVAFLGAKPTQIAANKTGVLTLRAWGNTEADMTAKWEVEA